MYSLLRAFHLLVLVVDLYGLYVFFHIPQIASPWYRPLRFLTVWNAILQPLYFLFVLITDFFAHRITHLKKTQSALFYGVVLPMGMFVTITFWGIYAIDRELIFSKRMEAYYPALLNHQQHTLVALFVVLELILARRPRHSPWTERTLLLLFNVAYIVVVVSVWYMTEQWVYPVLAVLDNGSRVMFFVGCALLCLAIHATVTRAAARWIHAHVPHPKSQ